MFATPACLTSFYTCIMDEPPSKRPKASGCNIKTLDEYNAWKKEQKTTECAGEGLSSRIFKRGAEYIVKEQILGWTENAWKSLQVYRNDVPGVAKVRASIFSSKPLDDAQLNNILHLRTHEFEKETKALELASEIGVTPQLVEWFFVDLGPQFRLGVTVQQKLYRVFRDWEKKHGYDEMLSRMQMVGINQFYKTVKLLNDAGLVYFDWNCGNMGITSTMQLQLIDFACCLRTPEVEMKNKEEVHLKPRLEQLWRRSVSLRAMKRCFEMMANRDDDFRCLMYHPVRREHKKAERLCKDYMHEYAHPDTDIDSVLSEEMFTDLEF